MMKTSLVVLSLFLGFAANADQHYIPPITVDLMSLINWKVGDSSDSNINATFGNIGTMHKEVTKEEGKGVWLLEDVTAMGKKDKTEVLIDRDSGKTLKMIHNGKEETVPDDKVQIISQDYTQVTVPAGTFKVMHVVAKAKDVDHLELWVNNVDIVIDGAAKTVMSTQFGDMTIELTKQHKVQ